MRPYELLDHTADAKFRAYGTTMEEAFEHAVQALTAIVVEPSEVKETKTQTISVTGDESKKLLFNLLDQIIYLIDTEHFLPARAELVLVNNTLTGTLYGDDVKKYGGNLKAVTYSEMLCEEQNGKWVVQVVVDV